MIYALAHFTKLKPTINPVNCHYIKAEEITQFHQRNQMISENVWNALLYILPPFLVNAFLTISC